MNIDTKNSLDNTVLFIIASNGNLSNYRARKIYELSRFFKRIHIISQRHADNISNTTIVGSYPNFTWVFKKLGMTKIKEYFDKHLYFPTPDILFVYKSYFFLKNIVLENLKNGQKVIVLCITPPHAISIIGYLLKKKYPIIKFVADWQDLWTYDEYYFYRTAKLYQNHLKRLEKKIFYNCDMNVTTNYKARDVLINEFGVPKEQVLDIVHPYDEHELRPYERDIKSDNRIKIGFLGMLIKHPKMPGELIIEAVKYVHDKKFPVEFIVYGPSQELTKREVDKVNEGYIRLNKSIPHEESLNKIKYCDFLTLSLSDLKNTKVVMHAKLSHYFLLKKPIIAFAPEDSFAAIAIRETKTGYIISNTHNVGKSLLKILQSFNYGEYLKNRNEEEIKKYAWENNSKRWINLFSSI